MVKVTCKFTAKLGGLKQIKPDEKAFEGATTVGELQRLLGSKVVDSGVSKQQTLHIFVTQTEEAFMPTPDQTLEALCDLFGIGEGAQRKLTLAYCLQIFQG